MSEPKQGFICEPDPEFPGWMRWRVSDPTRFNEAVLGRMIVKVEGPDHCRSRIFPQRHLTNIAGSIHGGATMGLIDLAIFSALQLLRGVDAARSVTLGIEAQFIDAGDPEKPLDAVVEVLRETKRLGFVRGLVQQDEALIAAFSATIRKPTAPGKAAGA